MREDDEVSQRFIDLLNVPLEVLREIGDEKEIVGAASMNKWPIAEELASLARSELETLTRGFLYAGKTSLSFFRVDVPPKEKQKADDAENRQTDEPAPDGDGDDAERPEDRDVILEGRELEDERVDTVLRTMSPAGDPFDEQIRPAAVTRDPQLVRAIKRDDDSLLLTFVLEGTAALTLHNFTIQRVLADEFFSAVLYPKDGFVEVRTNQLTAARFRRTWMEEFAKSFGLAAYPVSISQDDFDALAQELDAGTARFRGKNTSGGAVDTVEVKMAPGFHTLNGDPTFEAKKAGTEQQVGDLLFDDGGTEYRIRISRARGSIYFVKPAPESVIDRVRQALRKVKVRHRRA